MAWFFTEENISGSNYTLVGESAKHISKVLRMRTGEDITLVSPDKTQYECKISLITQGEVTVDIISQKPCENEPDVFVTLYQALPKGDKMDFIVQKCTELGISRIVPMISARCVSRPDEKSLRFITSFALSPTSARKSLLLRACMRIQRLRCALSTVMLFIWQDLQHTHQHM